MAAGAGAARGGGAAMGAAALVASHATAVEVNFPAKAPPPAAAVAVLVTSINRSLAPVLWFDDTFLMGNPAGEPRCSGGVWAVPAGQSLRPLGSPLADYLVTDPNGHTWTVVKYNTDPSDPSSSRKWGVEVAAEPSPWGNGCAIGEQVTRYDPGPGNSTIATPESFLYNALLWLPLDEVGSSTGSVTYGNQPSPAPNDADNASQGNSHAYNDVYQANHGPWHQHETYDVDLYWTVEAPTPSGNVTFDNAGHHGGYHQH